MTGIENRTKKQEKRALNLDNMRCFLAKKKEYWIKMCIFFSKIASAFGKRVEKPIVL